jgi:hypothetical protein
MVEPYRIVQDELMVSLAPVIANPVILVNDKSVDIEHLQPGSGRQASLPGAWRDVRPYHH